MFYASAQRYIGGYQDLTLVQFLIDAIVDDTVTSPFRFAKVDKPVYGFGDAVQLARVPAFRELAEEVDLLW